MTLMYEVGAGVDIKGKEAWKVDKILCECVHTVHTLEMDICTSRQKLVGYIKIELLGYYSCWVRTNPFNFSKTFLFLRSYESLFKPTSN